MTESADDGRNPQDDSVRSAVSPGELLRRARESLNLTISDLAGQTRLSRAVLEALERNDFASLAMPVYVRGYFRKCAHVLHVPEDKLLNAYAEWTGTPLTPQPLPVTVSEPPEEYASPGRNPSWRYVVIIAVVMGAVLWWFGSGDAPNPTPVAQTDDGLATVPLDPGPATLEPLPLPPAREGADTGAGDTAAGGADGAAPAPVPGAATVPATGSAASAAETPLPPPGPTTLHLSITRTSWVEVYDDDRQRLVYGLLQPGTEQRVNGRPPYQIVLGHPQGVRMSLGGKVIDLTPYTERDGTARFKLKGP